MTAQILDFPERTDRITVYDAVDIACGNCNGTDLKLQSINNHTQVIM